MGLFSKLFKRSNQTEQPVAQDGSQPSAGDASTTPADPAAQPPAATPPVDSTDSPAPQASGNQNPDQQDTPPAPQ